MVLWLELNHMVISRILLCMQLSVRTADAWSWDSFSLSYSPQCLVPPAKIWIRWQPVTSGRGKFS